MELTQEQREAIGEARSAFEPTNRAISRGAESMLYTPIPVLDHGFVRLIDYMGNDQAIAQAARVSYAAETKHVRTERGLIRYLMRKWHTSPFEMCEIKLHMKMPMFIGEQTLRHRTANVNKESGRYSVMSKDKYVPARDRLAKQSTTNKQGSGEPFAGYEAMRVLGKIELIHHQIQQIYDEFVSEDVDLARELARGILPANQYAEFYWKIDLHNLFHFLQLRADTHAQFEIRCYAQAIIEIVRHWVPEAYEAFLDYRQDARTFSGPEMQVLLAALSPEQIKALSEAAMASSRLSQREIAEFIQKITPTL